VRAQRCLRIGAAAACALLAAGCLFSDKTVAGRTLHKAPKVLGNASSVAVTVAVTSRLVRLGTMTSVPAPDPGLLLTGVIDPRTNRAFYAVAGSTKPSVVFSGTELYALIPNASPDDARPWVSVAASKKLTDFQLNPSAVPASLAAFALRPLLLVDFLSGALTGSIHRVGAATVQGASTTEYQARFDLEQALANATRTHYSQKQQDDLAKLFKVLSIKSGDIDTGTVWIDAQGNPRRISLAITESPAYKSKILLNVDMQLKPQRTVVPIAVPRPDTVETVPSLSQYLDPLRARLGGPR
jgi:hypothetical protein